MTFFNTNTDNKVKLRLDSIMANDVYQKNNITGNYDRIDNSSSEPISLPYYLKTTDIEMNNVVTGKGTVLNDNALIIGDSSGNETLNKSSLSILNKIKTEAIDPAVGTGFTNYPISYNKVTDKFKLMTDTWTIGTSGSSCINLTSSNIQVYTSASALNLMPTGLRLFTSATGSKFLQMADIIATNSLVTDIISPAATSSNPDMKYLVAYDKTNNKFVRASSAFFLEYVNYRSTIGADAVRFSSTTNSLKSSLDNESLTLFDGSQNNILYAKILEKGEFCCIGAQHHRCIYTLRSIFTLH